MEKLERNELKLNLKIQLKNAASKKLRLRIQLSDIQWLNTYTY